MRHSLPYRRQSRAKSYSGAPDTIRTCDLCLRRVALYPAELRAQCLAVQRPNESNPLGVCCDIVKPVFSTTLYDAAPVRERDVVRQSIDRSTLRSRSLVTWRGSFAE